MSNALVATFWSFLQRGGGIIISFGSNIILARLLFPEDFGIIGLIMVFSSLADTLVDAGLGSALIQKENITERDISTVFTTNVLFSVFLFLILFVSAPFIADYVGVLGFDLFLRVQITTIIFRALYVVEFSMLNKQLKFRDLAKINLIASFFSAAIAIMFAYLDYGVWSLIIKNITLQIFLVLLYKIYIKVKFSIDFYKESFKELFSFGGYVSLTYLFDFIFSNTVTFLLGKKYSVKDLGYYTQANSLRQIPINTLSLVVGQVMFPFFSKFQNDKKKVIDSMSKTISVISFFIFPLLCFLILFAEPIIVLLFSEKWLPSAEIFKILCLAGFVNALIHANRSVLKSLGYSKSLFLAQAFSTTMGLLLIFIGLQYSLNTLLVLIVLNSYVNYLIVGLVVHQKIGYFIWNQLKDLLLNLIISVFVSYPVFLISNSLSINYVLLLAMNFIIFAACYTGVHYLFKSNSLKSVKGIFLTKKTI